MARRSAAQIAIEEWGNHHVRLVERTFDKRRLLDEVWGARGRGDHPEAAGLPVRR
jgi:hypothetical protein